MDKLERGITFKSLISIIGLMEFGLKIMIILKSTWSNYSKKSILCRLCLRSNLRPKVKNLKIGKIERERRKHIFLYSNSKSMIKEISEGSICNFKDAE